MPKPGPTAGINLSHSLADGLLMSFAMSEGSGLPKERLAQVAPDDTMGEGLLEWLGDGGGALHFRGVEGLGQGTALEYETDVFDGLGAITIIASMTIDKGTWGHPDAFPNQPYSAFFAKQFDDADQSAFFIGYGRNDEHEGGLRDELFAVIPGSPPCYYAFSVSSLPWATQYQQVSFVYDRTAAANARWICRVDGVQIARIMDAVYDPSGNDGTPFIPTTTAPVVLGARTISPALNGVHHGAFQYLHAFEGARQNLWSELAPNPYAFYDDQTAVKTINGVPRAQIKTINGVPIAQVKTVGGLV